MAKETIIVIIDTLSRGGAETLLVGILPQLSQRYKVILVTLSEQCDYDQNELVFYKRYILGYKNKLSIPGCVRKLRRIIHDNHPQIIHSHLLYSNIVARLACPKNVQLFYSFHSEMSKSAFDNSRILTFIEKNITRENHTLIAVSNEILMDYEKCIRMMHNKKVLTNYVGDEFTNRTVKKYVPNKKLNLVTVGNIKVVKNHQFLVDAFKHLHGYDICMDIYGTDSGHLQKSLQEQVDANGLPIKFKGLAFNVHDVLLKYDLFVLCSKSEGMPLSVLEAMASGLPLLLSDLPSLKNMTQHNALFFDVNDPLSFVALVKNILNDKYDLKKLAEHGVDIVRKHYSKTIYLKKLFSIYDEALRPSLSRNVNTVTEPI